MERAPFAKTRDVAWTAGGEMRRAVVTSKRSRSGLARGLCDACRMYRQDRGHHKEAVERTPGPLIIERRAVEKLLIKGDQQTPEPSTH